MQGLIWWMFEIVSFFGSHSPKMLCEAMNSPCRRSDACMHVKALQAPAAGGQRFIASNGPISGNEYCLVSAPCHPSTQQTC